MTMKLATGIWMFSNAPDRFCTEGYRESLRPQDALAAIAKVKSVKGVEIRQTDNVRFTCKGNEALTKGKRTGLRWRDDKFITFQAFCLSRIWAPAPENP